MIGKQAGEGLPPKLAAEASFPYTFAFLCPAIATAYPKYPDEPDWKTLLRTVPPKVLAAVLLSEPQTCDERAGKVSYNGLAKSKAFETYHSTDGDSDLHHVRVGDESVAFDDGSFEGSRPRVPVDHVDTSKGSTIARDDRVARDGRTESSEDDDTSVRAVDDGVSGHG